MEKFEQLHSLILQWAEERGIFHEVNGSTPFKQYLKFLTEVGELAESLIKDDKQAIKDAIGDCIVCLINKLELEGNDEIKVKKPLIFNTINEICSQKRSINELIKRMLTLSYTDGVWSIIYLYAIEHEMGFNQNECLEFAYNEIKDRKGKMINGEFVKQ